MQTKQLLMNKVEKVEKDEKSKTKIKDILFELFKSHIGKENSISRKEIFIRIFGEPSRFSMEQIYFLWKVILSSMHNIRRTTQMFIVSDEIILNNKSQYIYFVPTSFEEIEHYTNHLENTIKKCGYMIKRCKKSIEERWFENVGEEDE